MTSHPLALLLGGKPEAARSEKIGIILTIGFVREVHCCRIGSVIDNDNDNRGHILARV